MDNLETTAKQYITSLLTSTPLIVTMYQLSKDYRNTIGEPIPYQKLGYNSLEHFLRSIEDTVQVKGSGPSAQVIPVYSEKSAHVSDLVSNQRVTKPKLNSRNRPRNFQCRRMTYYPEKTFKPTFSPAGYNYGNSRPQERPTKKIHYPTKEVSTISKSSSQSSNSFDYVSYDNVLEADTKKVNVPVTPSIQTTGLNKTTFNTEATQNVETSRVEEKERLELKKVSSDKPTSKKCLSIRNILKNITTSDKNKASTEQENRIPFYVRNNLRCLISQFPNGIWCAEVPEQYRKLFKQELNYQELGFNSLMDLCVSLSSVFHYVRPSTEDFKLYDRSRPLPACAEKKFTIASYGVNQRGFCNVESDGALPNIDWADVNTFLPEDIFKPGQEIPRAFVPDNIQENDTIDVVVGEIYDLSKFWVYLEDSLLDKLMDEMQEYYKFHASEYTIPNQLIKEGLYCVQVIFGEYHRALIVDVMPEVEDTIRVIFIDYGTMTKVSTVGLCFLHTQFSSLPAQAIRCRLANIMPLEEGIPWSREASKAFRKLVADRDTSAKISHINWEEQILEVHLADVSNEANVFYINDKLVEDGFATYPNKERRKPRVDPVYTPIVKLLHLFPTFLELEHGLAPSTSEMEVFHDCEIPINFCYPQYFYVDYSLEEEIIKIAEELHEEHIVKRKRRTPKRCYDMQKFRTVPLDSRVFSNLENEIMAFLNKSSIEENDHTSDEDFIDADEEFLNKGDDSIVDQIRALNMKEEETVNFLRRDLQVTEDIMKDINRICKTGDTDFIESETLKSEFSSFNLCSELENDQVESETAFEENPTENERELWTINETRESMETSIASDAFRESPKKLNGDYGETFFKHPLSKMSFDREFSTEDEKSPSTNSWSSGRSPPYDLCVPDIQLTPVDLANADAFVSKISELLSVDGTTQREIKSTGVSNNPFLNNISDPNPDVSLAGLRLNPNNPFLTSSLHSSSNSSTSTLYESPIMEVKTVHSWSRFDDMSMATISELGRRLSSISTPACSVVADNRENCSISTQTSDEEVRPPQPRAANYPNYPQSYPTPMAYGYAQWSLGYANPFYGPNSQYGYYEPHGPAYRPPPPPPGFPMPPVFAPMAGPPNYMPQRMPQRPPGCFPMGNVPLRPDGPYGLSYYCERPLPAAGPPAQFVRSMGTASMASVSVNVAGKGKDFYDAYNEQLRMRPNEDAK